MPDTARTPRIIQKALVCSEWLYMQLMRAYPASFRHIYAARMLLVFRDSCRDALRTRGLIGLLLLWGSTCCDLLLSVPAECWQTFKEGTTSMALNVQPRRFSLRLWLVSCATLLAFLVALVASLNLYLIEDSSPLTSAAYSASPLLRFSYDGIYLSALAAGVAICAIAMYALVPRTRMATAGLGVLALLVACAGFGGLLARHSTTFLAFLAVFAVLLLADFLGGRTITTCASRRLDIRSARVLGACAGVGGLLLVNVTALVVHTLILNPLSHALYMQGQIPGTHFNLSLLAMAGAVLTLLIYALCLGNALRLPSRRA